MDEVKLLADRFQAPMDEQTELGPHLLALISEPLPSRRHHLETMVYANELR
jgi:hypothetical protein